MYVSVSISPSIAATSIRLQCALIMCATKHLPLCYVSENIAIAIPVRRLSLIASVTHSYWVHSAFCAGGGLAVRVYMCGTLALIVVNLVLLVALVNRSAQGSIADTHARRHVAPLLVVK